MRRIPWGSTTPLGFENKVKYPVQKVPLEEASEEDFIVIGKALNSVPEVPAKLYKSALYRHVLISGATGSGKSHTASIIAERVSKYLGIPVIIIDWHGEHVNLLEDYSIINPFETPLEIFTGDLRDISIISSILELTPPQEYMLEKIVKKTDFSKVKTLEAFLDLLEYYPDESSWMRETKLSLHRKLSVLARYGEDLFHLAKHGYSSLNYILNQSWNKPSILDVSKIGDIGVRKLYSAFYVKKLVDEAIKANQPLVVIIEEAQNYLSRNQPVKPLCDMLREVRKFNIGLVVISQSISQLSDDALMNTNTKIVHSIKARADLEVVEKSLYLERDLATVLPYLEPGEALYSTPTLKKPILIKVE